MWGVLGPDNRAPWRSRGTQPHKAAFQGAEEGVASTSWTKNVFASVMGTTEVGTAEQNLQRTHKGIQVKGPGISSERIQAPRHKATSKHTSIPTRSPWAAEGLKPH